MQGASSPPAGPIHTPLAHLEDPRHRSPLCGVRPAALQRDHGGPDDGRKGPDGDGGQGGGLGGRSGEKEVLRWCV